MSKKLVLLLHRIEISGLFMGHYEPTSSLTIKNIFWMLFIMYWVLKTFLTWLKSFSKLFVIHSIQTGSTIRLKEFLSLLLYFITSCRHHPTVNHWQGQVTQTSHLRIRIQCNNKTHRIRGEIIDIKTICYLGHIETTEPRQGSYDNISRAVSIYNDSAKYLYCIYGLTV